MVSPDSGEYVKRGAERHLVLYRADVPAQRLDNLRRHLATICSPSRTPCFQMRLIPLGEHVTPWLWSPIQTMSVSNLVANALVTKSPNSITYMCIEGSIE